MAGPGCFCWTKFDHFGAYSMDFDNPQSTVITSSPMVSFSFGPFLSSWIFWATLGPLYYWPNLVIRVTLVFSGSSIFCVISHFGLFRPLLQAPFSYLTLYCLIVNESSGPNRVKHHIFYSVHIHISKHRVILTIPHCISNPKPLISLQPTKAFMRLS